jgi:hypothetical protein
MHSRLPGCHLDLEGHGRAAARDEIPGLSSASRGGPSLAGFASRPYIAGAITNTPDHLTAWIQHPRDIEPSTAMPDLDLSETDARDAAAYLLSR